MTTRWANARVELQCEVNFGLCSIRKGVVLEFYIQLLSYNAVRYKLQPSRQCLDNFKNIQTQFRYFPSLTDNFRLSLESCIPALELMCLGVSTYILYPQSKHIFQAKLKFQSWTQVWQTLSRILSSFSNA